MAKKVNYKEMYTEEQIKAKISEHMDMLMSGNLPANCSREQITEVIKLYQDVLKEIKA